MAAKIDVYREIGRLLGDSRIATLSDDTAQRYAIDDAWPRAVEYVLRQAYWRFALKTVYPAPTNIVPPIAGYTNVFALPSDWLRSHAIFVTNDSNGQECPIDVKHQLEQLFTNTAPVNLRYVSSDYADPDTWPEQFSHAVAVRVAYEVADRITADPARTEQMLAKWKEAMQIAMAADAIPEDNWLRFQLNGQLLVGYKWLLDEGFWRFAIKTASLTGTAIDVSPGYSFAAFPPDDLGRIFQYYYPTTTTLPYAMPVIDLDYRFEGGRLHSQYQNTVIRYISTDGEDSTLWTDGFRRALLAYLELEEVKRNPQSPGAVLQARMLAFREAFENAKIKDDLTERPRFNNVSQMTRSRRRRWGTFSVEQGWL
ncbi:MAG: hypothetical protein KGP14_02390 [Betaproteobacteria bacterium]|nr:hypothetical protein [Betaproteobacteria bacterium]